jgi:hypothetical protein
MNGYAWVTRGVFAHVLVCAIGASVVGDDCFNLHTLLVQDRGKSTREENDIVVDRDKNLYALPVRGLSFRLNILHVQIAPEADRGLVSHTRRPSSNRFALELTDGLFPGSVQSDRAMLNDGSALSRSETMGFANGQGILSAGSA